MIEEASIRKARRIAEKSLKQFKVFNPLALDFSSCEKGGWNATTSCNLLDSFEEAQELGLKKLDEFLESPRVEAICDRIAA